MRSMAVAFLFCISSLAQGDVAKNKAIKDPVVIKIKGSKREIKTSEILAMLARLTGKNLGTLPPNELKKLIDIASKIIAKRYIMEDFASKKNYENNPKFKAIFETAKKEASIKALQADILDEIKEKDVNQAYPQFIKEKGRLLQFKFRIISVDDESVAKLIIQSLRNGFAFDKLAKEKSLHQSAKNEFAPGLVGPLREDKVLQEFGRDFFLAIASENFKQGSLSEKPLKLSNGKYAVIRLEERGKAPDLSVKEAEFGIKFWLLEKKIAKIVDDAIKAGEVEFLEIKD